MLVFRFGVSMPGAVWTRICEYEFAFRVFSVLVFAFALLTAFSLPFLERGTAEFAVTVYNVVLLSVLVVVLLAVRYKCE